MSAAPRRRYHVFLPLTLIFLGAGILVAQLGWMSDDALRRLGATWPVFVILAGLGVIFRANMAPRPAALALTVAFVVLCSGATAYAAVGPDLSGGRVTVTGSPSRGSIQSATLVVNAAGVALDVKTGDTGTSLLTASVTGDANSNPAIDMDTNNATVTIDSQAHSSWPFWPRHTSDVTVTLSQDVRWSLTVNGATVDGRVDLHDTAASVQVNAASGHPTLVFSGAHGTVPIELNGASVDTTVTVPTATAVRVTANGLAASINVDGQDRAAVGNQAWQDTSFASAADRFDIRANGASARVHLTHG